MKKIWNAIVDGFAYLVAAVIVASGVLIPVTAVAWCIQFWINLFS